MANTSISIIDHLNQLNIESTPEKKIHNNSNNFNDSIVALNSDPPSQSKSRLDRTWHKNFTIVTFPFFFIGFPSHLLISTKPGEPKVTWKNWLLLVFYPRKNILLGLITIPLFTFALIISYFVFYEIWLIFHTLLIKGEINVELFYQGVKVARILPGYIPMIAIWLYGYPLRNLITSFDIFRDDFKKYCNSNGEFLLKSTPPSNLLVKFTFIYFGIIFTHLIPNFTTVDWELTGGRDKLIYWVDITYSLILPFYLMFLLGIQSQYKLMSRFMNILVRENERPDLETLLHIKYLYKRLVRQVIYVNEVFGIYLSWVIPAHAYTIGVHVLLVLLYFMGLAQLATIIPLFDPLDLSTPQLVRSTVGNVVVVIIYLLICGYIIWEAIWTNDEIRFTQILLNDYLSDRDRDPPALLVQTDEVYKSARHLKFILQSTSKQQNPALIRIYIVNYFRWLNNRLHSSDLYHINVHGRFIKDTV